MNVTKIGRDRENLAQHSLHTLFAYHVDHKNASDLIQNSVREIGPFIVRTALVAHHSRIFFPSIFDREILSFRTNRLLLTLLVMYELKLLSYFVHFEYHDNINNHL